MSVEVARKLGDKVRDTKAKVINTMHLHKQLKIRYKNALAAQETARRTQMLPCIELTNGVKKLDDELNQSMCDLTDYMCDLDLLRRDLEEIVQEAESLAHFAKKLHDTCACPELAKFQELVEAYASNDSPVSDEYPDFSEVLAEFYEDKYENSDEQEHRDLIEVFGDYSRAFYDGVKEKPEEAEEETAEETTEGSEEN